MKIKNSSLANTKVCNLQELFDNLKVGIFRSSPSPRGRIICFNAAFKKMMGYQDGDLFKKPAREFFVDPQHFRSMLQRTLRDGFVDSQEMRVKRKDRKLFWSSVSMVLSKDSQGKSRGVDVLIEDITARKRVESESIGPHELFRVVFDNSAAAIIITDEHEKIIAWNPFAEKILEMNKEDLFNKPIRDLYPPQEWRRMRSFRMRRRRMLSDIETQIIKKDGSFLDVNLSVSILRDARGNVTGSIGIMRDITKQKLAERRIRESENKIRVILDNSAAAITLTDDQKRVVSWNKFTEHLLGMKKTDLYLKPVSELYPKEEWKKIRSQNIRHTGSHHHWETKILRKDKTVIDVDLSINVLKDSDGKVTGSVGIMQDITEQKRFQEMLVHAKMAAEEASSAKSLFLANMSHEVRTPMSTIMGMIDLTLDTPLDAQQQDNLKVAKEATDNLLGLINDILDLSRVEAGKMNLETIEFNLQDILKSVVKGLSVLADKKNIQLDYHIASDVPEIIKGDPVRLRQVLVNIINNAIKFTPEGSVTTSVQVSSKDEKECQLCFAVIDTGIGIPKDKQGLIFEAFTQVDVSTVRNYGGTGLGLTISKHLVQLMNGRIWVESEEGKGSIFNFTASFKLSPKDPQAFKELIKQIDPSSRQITSQDIKHLSILLAEDNIVNQKIAVKMLEKYGWDVCAVGNGQEVLDIIKKNSFDVVLMDVQMPALDGLETTRRIREEEKKTGGHLPIVALTARVMEDDKKKMLEVGMDGFVAKPIEREKLYETIVNQFKKGK